MDAPHLHIVAFNVPFPADYGGVIDVFFKIKTLAKAGAKIHLHCFQYGRKQALELENLCEDVNYYPRKTGLIGIAPKLPYIVSSRRSKTLLTNLQNDDYPILFEGLHSCYYLNHSSLKDRKRFVRTHNVEWHYYRDLAKVEGSFFRKLYLKTESKRLKTFEKKLQAATAIFPISPNDTLYYLSLIHI